MTASELAQQLDVALEGADGNIDGAAPIAWAAANDLIFVEGAKSFEAARASQARFVIAPAAYIPAAHQSVIPSGSPRALFAQALHLLYPARPVSPGVHPTAVIAADTIIDATAEIGPHCTIGQACTIGPHTRVGAGCHLGDRVYIGESGELHAAVTIYRDVRIGNRVILHSGVVVAADGFGFVSQNSVWAKFPQVGRVEIEDDVEIGANSCVDRAALGVTRIGAGSKLDNMVHVGHNCDVGKNVVIAAQTGLSGGVAIGDGAIIGGQVGIGDKARIEAGVVLGSGSGVLTSKIVRAGEPLWGTPARPLKTYLEQLALLARLPALRRRIEQLERKDS